MTLNLLKQHWVAADLADDLYFFRVGPPYYYAKFVIYSIFATLDLQQYT